MMKVPLLDLKAQYAPIREEIRAAMDRVCDSQYFILGPEVQGLEEETAKYCGAAHAVGMSSGTDALLAALMAVNVGPGDEVVTTAYSFFATAGAVVRLGAKPVFVDIERDSFNIDARQVEAKLTAKTKAILPVHLYGRCADLDPLLALAQSRKIALIEDAAQAIGSTDAKGRQAGSVGAMGCFSFFPTKNLGGFGDGGLVTTNDAGLAESLRVLRAHGSKPKYYHKIVGGNFRLDALQAAILRVKLKHLPAWTAGRRSNADRYRTLFGAAGLGAKVVLPSDVLGHIYNQFVIQVENRDRLQAYLTEQGIGTEIYYPVPLHLQECFAGVGYRKGDLPVSEEMAATTLALPIYPELTEPMQRAVVDAIASFHRR
jgi:dTDP-4-amino-4,6-dideoxygalactose transaminase